MFFFFPLSSLHLKRFIECESKLNKCLQACSRHRGCYDEQHRQSEFTVEDKQANAADTLRKAIKTKTQAVGVLRYLRQALWEETLRG